MITLTNVDGIVTLFLDWILFLLKFFHLPRTGVSNIMPAGQNWPTRGLNQARLMKTLHVHDVLINYIIIKCGYSPVLCMETKGENMDLLLFTSNCVMTLLVRPAWHVKSKSFITFVLVLGQCWWKQWRWWCENDSDTARHHLNWLWVTSATGGFFKPSQRACVI